MPVAPRGALGPSGLGMLLLLLATTHTRSAAGGPKWVWAGMEDWSWDRLQVATWGMPPVGRGYNSSEIAFKERFQVMFVDNLRGTDGGGS